MFRNGRTTYLAHRPSLENVVGGFLQASHRCQANPAIGPCIFLCDIRLNRRPVNLLAVLFAVHFAILYLTVIGVKSVSPLSATDQRSSADPCVADTIKSPMPGCRSQFSCHTHFFSTYVGCAEFCDRPTSQNFGSEQNCRDTADTRASRNKLQEQFLTFASGREVPLHMLYS